MESPIQPLYVPLPYGGFLNQNRHTYTCPGRSITCKGEGETPPTPKGLQGTLHTLAGSTRRNESSGLEG